MSLDDILKYQDEDKKLYALDMILAQSEANKKYQFFATDRAKNQDEIKIGVRELEKLYSQVEDRSVEIQKANQEIADIIETAGKFEELREVDLYEKKLMQLQKYIEQVERDINRINNAVSDINTKSRTAILKFKSCNQEIENARAEIEGAKHSQLNERQEIMKNMTPLKDKLPESLLIKYQEIRKRGKMPVVVKLDGCSCGGCHMDVDVQIINKMGNTLGECPNCGRLIYK